MQSSFTLVIALAAAAATAHFVLQIPPTIGYDDAQETVSPCGSFDPLTRTSVTDWPVNGAPVSIISTHDNVQWEVNAALISGGASLNWVPLVVPFAQRGVGFVCFDAVPGNPDWVGQEAVVQFIQHASDGLLYQCAAVRFVAGGPASVPTECENTAGVSHDPIVAPARPSTTTASTTETTTSPTSTSTSTSSGTGGPSTTSSSPTSASGSTSSTTSGGTSSGTSSGTSRPSSSSTGTSGAGGTTDEGHSHGGPTTTTSKGGVVATAAAEKQMAPLVAMQIAGVAAAAVLAVAGV